MPATYQDLLLETVPKRIEDDADCDRFHGRLGELLRLPKRSKAETELCQLLSLLIQDYDRRQALLPEETTPAERLQYLLEVSGKKPADLVPVFGQLSHVSALSGKRAISALQARKLGKMFHLKPGYFV